IRASSSANSSSKWSGEEEVVLPLNGLITSGEVKLVGLNSLKCHVSYSRIRDIGVKRIPLLHHIISLRMRFGFLDKRRHRNGRSIKNNTTLGGDGFILPFELTMVLLGRGPEPEVEAVFIWKKLAIMFLSSLVWLDIEA
nr:hypothetical protein [Tanacetum cinerariifolium]